MKNSTSQIMSKLGVCKATVKDEQSPEQQTEKPSQPEQKPAIAQPGNAMEQLMNMCLSPVIKDKKHTPAS